MIVIVFSFFHDKLCGWALALFVAFHGMFGWVARLELECHDLLSLFEFMDNGDGQITLTEFIEGSTRLRGSAKALDVWRLETKAGFASSRWRCMCHSTKFWQQRDFVT